MMVDSENSNRSAIYIAIFKIDISMINFVLYQFDFN